MADVLTNQLNPKSYMGKRDRQIRSALRIGKQGSVTAALVCILAFTVCVPVALPMMPVAVVQAAGFLVVVSYLLESLAHRKLLISHGLPWARVLLIGSFSVALVSVASGLVTGKPADSIGLSIRYLTGMLLILAISSSVSSPIRIKRVILALMMGAVAATIIAVIGQIVPSLGSLTVGTGLRSKSLFQHSNQFGMVMAAVVPVLVALIGLRRRTLIALVALAVIGYGILISGSLTNTILLICSFGLVPLLQSITSGRLRLTMVIVSTLVLAAGLLLIVTLNPADLSKRNERVGDLVRVIQGGGSQSFEEAFPSLRARLDLFEQSFTAVAATPLFGVGGDDASPYLTEGTQSRSHAHNLFINHLLLNGVMGLVAMIIMALGWLILAIRVIVVSDTKSEQTAYGIGLGAGLLLFFFSHQFSDSLGGITIYLLWLYAGIVVSILAKPRSDTGNGAA